MHCERSSKGVNHLPNNATVISQGIGIFLSSEVLDEPLGDKIHVAGCFSLNLRTKTMIMFIWNTCGMMDECI